MPSQTYTIRAENDPQRINFGPDAKIVTNIGNGPTASFISSSGTISISTGQSTTISGSALVTCDYGHCDLHSETASLLAGSASLPTGGTAGQALTKRSNTDGDTQWTTVSAAANSLGLLVFRGAWQASTSYAAGDVVIDPSAALPQLVVTPNAQTSGASYAQGAASSATRWVKIGTRLQFYGAWVAGTYYPAGALFVEPTGTLRESTLDHTSGASYDSTRSKAPRFFEPLITAATLVAPEDYLPAYHQALPASPFRMSFAPVRQKAGKRCATWTTSTGWTANNNGSLSEDTTDFIVPDRAVVLTTTPTVASFFTAPAFTAVDMSASGGYVRLGISINDITKISSGNGNCTLRLYSGGAASGSNYLEVTFCKNNETWLDGGDYKVLTIALADFAVVGTGATLTAITNAAFVMKATTSALIVRLQYLDFCVSQVTRAKVVLFFDDYVIDEAVRQMAPYGFPGVAAIARADMETGGNTTKVQRLRYMQDHLGWQIGSHSYSMAEHGSVHGDALTAQFAKTAAFDQAYGINGGMDFSYWGSGPSSKGDDRVRVRSFYRSGRWNQSGPRLIETMAPAMPELTRAWLTASGETSATNWQPWVTQAINARGLAQFVWHPGNLVSGGADATQFGTFLAWLATQAVDVVTADEAWRSLAATS